MERKQYIDFMKGIAIIGVIISHTATERLYEQNELFDLAIYETFFGLIHFAVPFFFMITGYLMLRPEKELSIKKLYLKSILRILVAAFIYGIIYKIERMVFDGSYNGILDFVKGYIIDFATGHLEFHFWYVYAILGVYITLPILKAFVKSANKKLLEYFIIVWFICNIFFVLYRSGYLTFVGDVFDQFHFVGLFVEYQGYLVLGYYLMSNEFSKKIKSIVVVCGMVAIIVAIIMMTYDMYNYGAYRLEYRAQCGPFIILYGSACCLLVKDLKMDYNNKILRFINWLGQNSLSIYFVHMVFIIMIFQYGICNYHIFPILDMIIYPLVVLMASALFKFIVNKIPYVRKWL